MLNSAGKIVPFPHTVSERFRVAARRFHAVVLALDPKVTTNKIESENKEDQQ
jgi:hypothetical protein